MKTEDTLGIALVKELCPICGKEMDGPIIMNQILTKENAENIKNMHNKIIGFADHCCEECAKCKDDVVFFIGIDESKSSKDSLKELYRTGQIVGIKKDADIVNNFKNYIITLKDSAKIIFIDETAGKEIGIFKSVENA